LIAQVLGYLSHTSINAPKRLKDVPGNVEYETQHEKRKQSKETSRGSNRHAASPFLLIVENSSIVLD
jgi:hypothetical protein